MKKIIIVAVLLIISVASFSQQTKSLPALTKQDYLVKSKHQNRTGWILLLGGTGSALILSVVVTVATQSLPAGAVTMAVGMLAVPASIPFFIAAHRNKKKGMSLSFKSETVPRLQSSSFINRSVPSLRLTIQF